MGVFLNLMLTFQKRQVAFLGFVTGSFLSLVLKRNPIRPHVLHEKSNILKQVFFFFFSLLELYSHCKRGGELKALKRE